jgi:hypothetical protein
VNSAAGLRVEGRPFSGGDKKLWKRPRGMHCCRGRDSGVQNAPKSRLQGSGKQQVAAAALVGGALATPGAAGSGRRS